MLCFVEDIIKSSGPDWGKTNNKKKKQPYLMGEVHVKAHAVSWYIRCDLQKIWQPLLSCEAASKPRRRPTNTYKQQQIVPQPDFSGCCRISLLFSLKDHEPFPLLALDLCILIKKKGKREKTC